MKINKLCYAGKRITALFPVLLFGGKYYDKGSFVCKIHDTNKDFKINYRLLFCKN
jgi:hypothetical protein